MKEKGYPKICKITCMNPKVQYLKKKLFCVYGTCILNLTKLICSIIDSCGFIVHYLHYSMYICSNSEQEAPQLPITHIP